VQLLFNQIFTQPARKNADGVFAELPRRLTVVPREKPLPREKPKTKWDEFAQIKGIQKGKRSSKRWNEERQDFVPRYGKGSVNNEKMQDWVMELPANAPDDIDMRADAKKIKKKALEKQAKQERGNKARARAKGQRQVNLFIYY
jgi:regulator of ribosome biosynthesis